jgi:flavodoxin
MARILIAYYSRTGTTKRVATDLARALRADIAEIRSVKRRRGLLGYLRSAVEAILETGAGIDRLEVDPAGYDLVVIGSPVWFASLSSPVRAFVWQNRDKMKDVAFYCTMGGRGGKRALQQAARECGREARATLLLREAAVERGVDWVKVREFVDRIQTFLDARASLDAKASDGNNPSSAVQQQLPSSR